MDKVISNVTNIIRSANQTSDQNSDNLRVVADVLTQTASVIQAHNVSLNLVTEVRNFNTLLTQLSLYMDWQLGNYRLHFLISHVAM